MIDGEVCVCVWGGGGGEVAECQKEGTGEGWRGQMH